MSATKSIIQEQNALIKLIFINVDVTTGLYGTVKHVFVSFVFLFEFKIVHT
jgi:hypothetical protein